MWGSVLVFVNAYAYIRARMWRPEVNLDCCVFGAFQAFLPFFCFLFLCSFYFWSQFLTETLSLLARDAHGSTCLCFLTIRFISMSETCSFFQMYVLAIKVGGGRGGSILLWQIYLSHLPGHIFYKNGCVVELQVLYIWRHRSVIEHRLC